MTAAVEIRDRISPERLAALGEIVEREHALAQDAARQALTHVIQAGEALREARTAVDSGAWNQWCERHGLGERRARDYIRIATYQSELPEWVTTRTEAIVSLKGLPVATENGGWQRLSDATREEALRLRAEGLSQRQVGEALGISHVTIGLWEREQPSSKTKRRARSRQASREKQARLALRQLERDRAMRKRGGTVAEAYSLLRRAAQMLDRARDGETSKEVRHHLDQALYGVHRAEESAAKALRIK